MCMIVYQVAMLDRDLPTTVRMVISNRDKALLNPVTHLQWGNLYQRQGFAESPVNEI